MTAAASDPGGGQAAAPGTLVFLESTGDRHALRVGGLTALERRVRELARAGATRVIAACPPVEFARPLPIPVDHVAPGSPPPDGARRERADVIAGIELVDAAAIARAEWALIRRLNKSFEGPIDALINWRFSMRITRLLARASLALTPNHITIIAILIGLGASLVASRGDHAGFAIAGAMLQLNSILDSCDGELARLRYQFSKLGQWLDNLSDDVVDNLFPVSVGLALGGTWAYLGIAAGGARVVVALATYLDVYRRTGTGDVFAFRWWFEADKATADDVYDRTSVLTWLRALGRRDTYVFLWMVACVAGFPYWVIGHALAIAAVYSALLLLQLTVFRRRRPAAGRAA